MLEIVTDAVVLDKIDLGEFDARVYLYTQDLGKITAKVQSARKIISKLAGHIEPLSLITARIVDKNGTLLVDALSQKRFKDAELVKIFLLVKELAAEGQKDIALWNFLKKIMREGANEKSGLEVLSLLGFDPTYAKCEHCRHGKPEKFSVRDLVFYCEKCHSEIKNADYVF